MLRLAVRSCLCFALIASAMAMTEVPVAFLPAAPVIDGVLDESLRTLPVQQFPVVQQLFGSRAEEAKPTYRIAYGASFLYLYIEVPGEEVLARDRAYQNGDGFHMAITRPQAGNAATREFYVMGFTTSSRPTLPRFKQFVWYRNVDLSFTPLKSARMATTSSNEHTGIELLLPWAELYPYHPWLSDAIGFNLCYVKGWGENARTYYYVVYDDAFQGEQSPRLYTRLKFDVPKLAAGTQAYAVLEGNHVGAGQQAEARVAVLSAGTAPLETVARVMSGEGTALAAMPVKIPAAAGLHTEKLTLPVSALPPGGYTIAWDMPVESATPLGLSIVPRFDAAAMRSRLKQAAGKIKPGSLTTLEYRLGEIETITRELKAYDVATMMRMSLIDFFDTLEAAEQGRDLIATQVGVQRRAYRSKVDGTLQPYSVRVPAQLEPGKLYPLIVFLHGSGEDDRRAMPSFQPPEDFIVVAPRGRGTSNAYTAEHAQDDIREAIEDVLANYPVDAKRIVLSGFSMGGYGVYRTYYEDPKRYRALAVFSGHPSLGLEMGPEHPDFTKDEYLKGFRGVPIFIFHGGKDRNAPVELTTGLVEKLKKAGADVEFHYVAEKGHEAPPPQVDAAFKNWLQRMMSNN